MIDFYKKYIKYKTKYISYITGGVGKKNILISCSNIGNINDAFIFRDYLHQLLVNMYGVNTSFYLTFITGTNKNYEYCNCLLSQEEFKTNKAIMETSGFTIKNIFNQDIYDFFQTNEDTFEFLIFLGCIRIHEVFQIKYFNSFLLCLYNKINDFLVICEFLATYENEFADSSITYDFVTHNQVTDFYNKSNRSIKEFNTLGEGYIFDDTIIEDINTIFQLYFEFVPTFKYYKKQKEQPTNVPLLKNNLLIKKKNKIINNYDTQGIFDFNATKNYLTSLKYNGVPFNLNWNLYFSKLESPESDLDRETISKIMEVLKTSILY